MIKKRFLVGISLSFLTLTSCSGVFDALVRAINFGNTSPTWVHYSKVNASTTQYGIKEYWVNCSTSEHVFKAPSGANIRDGGTPTRAFIDSLLEDDDRLIEPYRSIVDFENGRNSYISIYDKFSSLEVVDGEGIGGSKALRASYTATSRADPHLSIDKGFLDYVFSNSEVKSLSFYAKGTTITNNFRHKLVDKSLVNNNSNLISCYEQNLTGYGITNEYKLFYLSRNVYSQMDNTDWFIQYGGLSGEQYLYIDNISISYEDYFQYRYNSFEYGYSVTEYSNKAFRLRDRSNG